MDVHINWNNYVFWIMRTYFLSSWRPIYVLMRATLASMKLCITSNIISFGLSWRTESTQLFGVALLAITHILPTTRWNSPRITINTHSYASPLIVSVAFLWKLYVIFPSISMFSIFLISLFPFLALRNSPCRELLIYFVTMLWQVLASLSLLCLTQTIGSSVISQKLYGIYWVSK